MTRKRDDWDYGDEAGPEHWGHLHADFSPCIEGLCQSPIDIDSTNAIHGHLDPIHIDYKPSPLVIFNDGHTIRVNYMPGSTITHNDTTYELLQFHFHEPSEHTVDGQPYAMELHLVHKVPDENRLAVIGVLIVAGDEANPAYTQLFQHLPAAIGEPTQQGDLTVNAADLLPADCTHYYTYEGSLTTPPCSEIVHWLVLAQPVTLTKAQIDAFSAIHHNNVRPVQPLNKRNLLSNDG